MHVITFWLVCFDVQLNDPEQDDRSAPESSAPDLLSDSSEMSGDEDDQAMKDNNDVNDSDEGGESMDTDSK